jgi:hypothetical protein
MTRVFGRQRATNSAGSTGQESASSQMPLQYRILALVLPCSRAGIASGLKYPGENRTRLRLLGMAWVDNWAR